MSAGRWGDLRARVLSGIAIAVVGLGEIWLGGVAFHLLIVACAGLMIWELMRMTAPGNPAVAVGLGAMGAGALAGAPYLGLWMNAGVALVLGLVAALAASRLKPATAAYAVAVVLASVFLLMLRAVDLNLTLWLVLVVVMSDIMGYFAGRILGGPKFWPAISPKKTWSGTLAGWIGAAVVGLMLIPGGALTVILVSVGMSFAGQLGDIAESAIKRKTGVKDSSNLIPGHGGVLDRFDALIGASLVLGVAVFVFGLVETAIQ
ncbi:phosphatidate cytidylyltransferase [Mesobacterium sp. TK19101]|uniref:Phosphatidate cytidylyltransferase n=1 Tax=Mesobacterium hydrothermale TaxID=3111907 RepID=A0ABU6HGH1_9RHOB|nr:phosphatidate cytidylyltransferase [Mesobacterium sp. TK19101]MEC3860558.1 phosphatidate cytidylyltransferase [Mesobacterium sp. TK19101]